MRRLPFPLIAAALVVLFLPPDARSRAPVADPAGFEAASPGLLPTAAGADTAWFGYVDGSGYAVPGETWTFDHGGPDPFEGWTISDLTAAPYTAWRRITALEWSGHGNLPPAPVLSGNASLWLGLFEDEANALCWTDGLGYGDVWCQRLEGPLLTYDGSGSVTVAFTYFNDTEFGYDSTLVYLEFPSLGARVALAGGGFTGVIGSPGVPSSHLESVSGLGTLTGGAAAPFRLVFEFRSDTGWSDEDGDYPTVAGPFGLDDVSLSSNILEGPQLYDFEAGLDGFLPGICPPLGDDVGLADAASYPLPGGCTLEGNVLEFHDPTLTHPFGQHVRIDSPPVDLSGLLCGDTLEVLTRFDSHRDLPLNDGVLYRLSWSYYPFTCPATGATQWSPLHSTPYLYTSSPSCGRNTYRAADYGVPGDAEQIRVSLEVIARCDLFAPGLCTGVSNFSPLFDNIRVGAVRPAACYLSRQDAIDLVTTQLIAGNPYENTMAGFLYGSTGADSLLGTGCTVSPSDSTFVWTAGGPSYFIWLDNDPDYLWERPTTFVFVDALTGSIESYDAFTWPVIDGEPYFDFVDDGDSSPDLFRGGYPPLGTVFNYSSVPRPASQAWAVIVAGRATAPLEVRHLRNDIDTIQAILNGLPDGPKLPAGNITVLNSAAQGTGATNAEICSTLASLGQQNPPCKKLYFFYAGHGADDRSSRQGGMITRDGGRDDRMNWNQLRTKLLDTRAEEVCVFIMSCYSGNAVDSLQAEVPQPGGGTRRLKGAIFTSSGDNRCRGGQDGSPWLQAIAGCWNAASDIDGQNGVSGSEAVIWALATGGTPVTGNHPRARVIGERPVWVDRARTRSSTSGAAGGGTMTYKVTQACYRFGEDRRPDDEDSTACHTVICFQNHTGSPHTPTRDVKVQCRDRRGREVGDPIILEGDRLRVPANTCVCLEVVDDDCHSLTIEPAEKPGDLGDLAGFDPGPDSDAVRVTFTNTYERGEFVFQSFPIQAASGDLVTVSVDPVPGWNLNIDPSGTFFWPATAGTLDVVIRGEVPLLATTGQTLEAAFINATTGDSLCVRVDAFLADSLGASGVGAGTLHRLKHIEAVEGALVAGGLLDLEDVVFTHGVSDSLVVAPDGALRMHRVLVNADSGAVHTVRLRGDLDVLEAAVAFPEDGLRVDGATGSLGTVFVFESEGDGLHLSGDLSTLTMDMVSVDSTLGRGAVISGVPEVLIRHLNVRRAVGHDLVLESSSHAECRDCILEDETVAVEPGSRLTRSWSRTYALETAAGDTLAGVGVTVVDAMGDTVAVDTTAVAGFTDTFVLLQSVNDGGAVTWHTPHTVHLSVGSFDSTFVDTVNSESVKLIALPTGVLTTGEPPPIMTTLLAQNAPNPVVGATTIRFQLERAERVRLRVFDLQGRLIETLVDEPRPEGRHEVNWVPALPAGIYFYRLEAGEFRGVRKLLIVR